MHCFRLETYQKVSKLFTPFSALITYATGLFVTFEEHLLKNLVIILAKSQIFSTTITYIPYTRKSQSASSLFSL